MVRGTALLQQAASKGAAPKAKAKAVATQSPKKEEGGVAIAAIPKRDVCWLCLLLGFLCVFFVLKLFDLEFLKTQLDESSC